MTSSLALPDPPGNLAPSGPLDGVQLHVVRSLDDAMACARWAGERREGPLFFDTESGGLNPHRDVHRMIQLGDTRHGWAFDARGWGGVAVEILSKYAGELGAHNSPYDNRVLNVHTDFTPRWERTHDTLLAGHLADSVRPAALKPRAALEVDPRAMAGEAALEEGMRAQGWTWATVPFGFMPYTLYGAADPVLAAHLHQKFAPEILGRFRRNYELELATARICAGMMSTGLMIDRPFIHEQITRLMTEHDQVMAWLRAQYGPKFSISSAACIERLFADHGIPVMIFTDTGKPSISKDALKFYATAYPEHEPMIKAIARARKSGDVVNKYLRKFLALADGDVMHYQIWTSKARTGRMSVTDPPMQTYDRDEPAVRGAYIPRPGCVFISIDADQIEARLAAHLTQDQRMIADFRHADETGQSFFVIMASKIYSQDITKKDPRYTWTKNATYGQIYGAGLEKAARTAGVPVEQMRAVYTGTQQLYPGLQSYMNALIRQAKQAPRPEAYTLGGRRMYANRGHEYALFNYQDQGSAAEIMKQGQVELDAAGLGPFLRLDVHDEILFECPREDARDVLEVATRILTDRTSFSVPITWSGSILEDRWRKT